MPKNSIEPLSAYWKKRIATWRGQNYYEDVTADKRYAEFSASGLDYKGQLSSVYSRVGKGGGISVKASFGDLIGPKFLIASLSAGGNVNYSTESLIILQRAPDKLYAERVSTLKLSDSLPNEMWATAEPIVLQAFAGSRFEGTFKLGASFGVQAPLPAISLGTDELGFSLEAKLTAGGSFTGQIVQLRDSVTAYFPSPMASDLNVAYKISEALVEQLGLKASEQTTPSRADTIKEIEAWIVKQLKANRLTRESKPWFASLKSKTSTEQLVTDLSNLRLKLKQLMATMPQAAKDYKNVDRRDPQHFDENYGAYRDAAIAVEQIDCYLSFLNATEILPERFLNYFTLRTFEGALQATAESRAGGAIKITGTAGSAMTARAVASLSGKAAIKNVQYRHQTVCQGGKVAKALIITQDTTISYRQVTVSGGVDSNFGISPSKAYLEKSGAATKTGKTLYNTMTYQSSIAYWPKLVSSVAQGAPEKIPVYAYSGSGLVFGCSADLAKLLTLKNSAEDSTDSYLKNLSSQLKLSPNIIRDFINATFPDVTEKELESKSMDLPSTVFLESSFAYHSKIKLSAKKTSSIVSDRKVFFYELDSQLENETVGKFVKGLSEPIATPATPPPALEALRLRVRISDVNDTVTPLVSLGFTYVVGIYIDFSKLKGVGHEGFFDYHVQWYNNEAYNDPKNFVEAQARSVPPVALLHQS